MQILGIVQDTTKSYDRCFFPTALSAKRNLRRFFSRDSAQIQILFACKTIASN